MHSLVIRFFLLWGLFCQGFVSAATLEFAYVAHASSLSNNISVYTINQTTGALTGETTVPAGDGPMSIAVDPAGRFAYAANFYSNNISVYTINQATGALTAGTTVAAGMFPRSIAVHPAGKFAYVANRDSNNISVYTINQTTGALTAGDTTTTALGPTSVAVDPTGKFAYVANSNAANISVYTINQTTGALTAGDTAAAGRGPFSVAVDPTGKFAYVANSNAANISVYTINQTNGALTAGDTAAAGAAPISVAVDPTGKFAYVANSNAANISVYTINQTTGAIPVETRVASGSTPFSVTVDPSGKFAYVANFGSNTISVYTINQTTGALTARTSVATGANPSFVATTRITVPDLRQIRLSTSSLVFQAQKVGVTSAAQVITLTNTGNVTLNLGTMAASGDYITTSTCAATLAPGDSCTINVVFVTTYFGPRTGSLSISSDAAGSPHLITLNGTGTYTYLSYPLQLEQNWNLLGNSVNKVLDVSRVFGDPKIVSSVWKWNTKTASWQFYSPTLSASELQAYASGKGMAVLKFIYPGEGYWVNAKAKATLPSPTASAFENTAVNLLTGWNLVASGNDFSPTEFNSSLSSITPAISITSLWAWNSVAQKWYFYSPALASQGGTALSSYIANNGYLDFASANKTLGNGTGFWVNGTNANPLPLVTIRGIVATGAPAGCQRNLRQDADGHYYVEQCDGTAIYCNNFTNGARCVEASSGGRVGLKERIQNGTTYIKGVVQGVKDLISGKTVDNLFSYSRWVSDSDEVVNNVDKVTTAVGEIAERGVVYYDPPPRSSDLEIMDGIVKFGEPAYQVIKKVLGQVGEKLPATSPSEDPDYDPDPIRSPVDKVVETTDYRFNESTVFVDDRSGKNLGSANVQNMANGNVTPITATQVDLDAAWAKLVANKGQLPPACTSPNVTLSDGSCAAPTTCTTGGACATPTPVCTSPMVPQGGNCVKPALVCAPNEVLQNGVCVNIPTCYSPQVLQNNVCVTPTPTCYSPQVLQNNVCVTPTPTCYSPQVLQNNVCVTPTPTCYSPQVLQHNICVTPPTPTYQAAYSACFEGTPSLYTGTYCDAYAKALVAGSTPADANQKGANAAGSNVGNIGMGQPISSTGTPNTQIGNATCNPCGWWK